MRCLAMYGRIGLGLSEGMDGYCGLGFGVEGLAA